MILKRAFLVAAVLLLAGLLGGCISPQSFVDPAMPRLSYSDLAKRDEPIPLRLSVEFQRQGSPFPRADSTLQDNAERILRSTGLIVPATGNAAGDIRITVNNFGDMQDAVAKGIGTGLTFGLAGSTVRDNYELTIVITMDGKTVSRSGIRNSILTSIGNTTLPPGVDPVPPNVAFGRVLEQLLLAALQDIQKAGELGGAAPAGRASGGGATSLDDLKGLLPAGK